ncbi:MAG: cobaltochelatase subunit CobN [Methylobacter sp.]
MTEGEVRDKTRDEISQVATQNKIDRDMAWEASRIHDSFKAFADALHIQLHDLALANQPLGLATFGLPAEADLRLFTVMQMLGKPFIAALQPKDHEEMIVGDYKKLRDTPVWKLLDKHVRQNEPYTGDAKVGEMLAKAREYWPNQGDGELSPSRKEITLPPPTAAIRSKIRTYCPPDATSTASIFHAFLRRRLGKPGARKPKN